MHSIHRRAYARGFQCGVALKPFDDIVKTLKYEYFDSNSKPPGFLLLPMQHIFSVFS